MTVRTAKWYFVFFYCIINQFIMRKSVFLFVTLIAFVYCVSAQKEVIAVLETATVYLNGASLTHKAAASLPSGSYEVVINGLSPDIELSSLTVSANGVLVSATEFVECTLCPPPVHSR